VIGIFKNNLFFNSLLLLPYVIIVRIHALIEPVAYTVRESDALLTKVIFSMLDGALLQNIVAILLVYFQMLYVNRLVIKHRLSHPYTLLPGLVYAILISFLPEYTMLSPFLIANTFVLIAIGQIFKTYRKPKAADILFDIGFSIAVTALFVPNYIFLLVIGIVGLFVLRSMKVVEIFQMISGILLVLIAFCGILYLLDIPFLPELNKASIYPRLTLLEVRGVQLYTIGVIIFIAGFTVLSYGKYTVKKSIQIQKKVDILYWIMIATALILFMFTSIEPNQVLLICIPFSILLSLNFISIQNLLMQELIHIGALALLFAFHFGLL